MAVQVNQETYDTLVGQRVTYQAQVDGYENQLVNTQAEIDAFTTRVEQWDAIIADLVVVP